MQWHIEAGEKPRKVGFAQEELVKNTEANKTAAAGNNWCEDRSTPGCQCWIDPFPPMCECYGPDCNSIQDVKTSADSMSDKSTATVGPPAISLMLN